MFAFFSNCIELEETYDHLSAHLTRSFVLCCKQGDSRGVDWNLLCSHYLSRHETVLRDNRGISRLTVTSVMSSMKLRLLLPGSYL